MLEKHKFSSSPRSARALRRLSLLGGLLVIATVPMSCSAIDDEIAVYKAATTERKTVEPVTRVKKSYAYNNTSIVSASLRADDVKPVAVAVTYNPGAYTCSPSGFGQTSRCFLRQ